MADIFISYSQKATGPTEQLAEALQNMGYKVWWDDRLVAGQSFDHAIQQELLNADATIVIWSPESIKSDYVRMEAGIAWAFDKLVPVRLDDLAPEAIPSAFQRLHTVKYSDLTKLRESLEAVGAHPQKSGAPKSKEEILEALRTVSPQLPAAVEAFLARCQKDGFRIVTKKSIMLKSTIPGFGDINLGTMFPDGTLQTNYISESSERIGDASIAAGYLDGIAELLDGGSVRRDGKSWSWRVERYGRLPELETVLARQDEWIALMKETRSRFSAAARAVKT